MPITKNSGAGFALALDGGGTGCRAILEACNRAMAGQQVPPADDPAAQAMLSQAEAGIASFIDHLQVIPALPVAFNGGLGRIFAARMAGRWPIVGAKGSPLGGALLMARELALAPA